MINIVGNDWDVILEKEYKKNYFKNLIRKVNENYENSICFPKKDDIFKALKLTSYKDVKVVILGQDPYHGKNEANGLSFSINMEVKIAPSLRNIFKELEIELDIKRTNTDLTDWAQQGILLLNSILTVEEKSPLSHKNVGWEIFTDAIIKKISQKNDKIIFILWGNYARSKKKIIKEGNYIIESVHPSPLSANRGFFNNDIFIKTNELLIKDGKNPIIWG